MKTSYVVLAILAVAMIVLASGVDAKKRHKAKSAGGSAASVEVEHVPEECGQKTQNGDSLSMHYTGKLEDGTVFDSSVTRGTPFDFRLGSGQVIPCWDENLAGHCVGTRLILTCPPETAYGSRGAGGVIPPNAQLTFEVEVMAIN